MRSDDFHKQKSPRQRLSSTDELQKPKSPRQRLASTGDLHKQKSPRQRFSSPFTGSDFLFNTRQTGQRQGSWRRKSTQDDIKPGRVSFPLDLPSPETKSSRTSCPLSPFEKIKIESDRKTAHGHPLIVPAAYGEFGPVFDVFALFQNAVKKQTLEAYNMIERLVRYKYEVTHTDTDLFFDWFETFSDVVLVIFDVEETHVFPFLEQHGVTIPKPLSAEARSAVYSKVETSLNKVAECRDKVRLLPPGESIPNLSKLMNDFLHIIVRYYNTQSQLLPRLIFEADIDGDEEILLRSRFINALRAKNNYSISIPFVAHWLTGSQLRSWKVNYLGPVLSVRFEQWTRKFEATHGAIPQKLAQRLASGSEDDETLFSPPSLFSNRSLSSRRRQRSYKTPQFSSHF